MTEPTTRKELEAAILHKHLSLIGKKGIAVTRERHKDKLRAWGLKGSRAAVKARADNMRKGKK